MNDAALAVVQPAEAIGLTPMRFSVEQRRIILDTCASGCTEGEFAALIAIAEARRLNPLTQDCFFVKRWDRERGREIWSVQATIDSFRAKAEETGLYTGQDEPEFEYEPDGRTLRLARVRIYRRDWPRPAVGVARWAEYVQFTKDGKPTRFWARMPHNQLAKCAEALGFRKAFPSRFAKVYTPEEQEARYDAAPEVAITGGSKPAAPAPEPGLDVTELAAMKDDFMAMLRTAAHEEELREIGQRIKAAKLPLDVTQELSREYVRQRNEMRAGEA